MKVREIMKSEVVVVKSDTLVRDVLRTMVTHRITGVPVVDDSGKLLGFIPERNLIVRELAVAGHLKPDERAVYLDHREFTTMQRQIYGRTAREIMNKEVVTVEESSDVMDAVAKMMDNQVSRLPVLRGGRVVGHLSRTDILRTLLEVEEDAYSKDSHEAPSDDEVKRRVLEAIHRQMKVSATSLDVRVNSGLVYMSGTVAGLEDIKALEEMVEDVPGVRDVVNLLLVEHLLH